MKKRWLSLIVLAICFCLIVPMIVSCGCSKNGKGDTDTNKVTTDGDTDGDNTSDDTNQPGGSDTNTPSGSDTNTPGGSDTNTPGGSDTNTPGGSDTNTPGSSDKPEIENPTGSASTLEYKAAPIIKYLRISELGENSITLKVNVIGDVKSYELRYSTKAITEKNYAKATVLDSFEMSGDGEIKTIVVPNMKADADNKYYFALTASNDDFTTDFITVRAGGIEIIERDYTNPQHLIVGETNRNLTAIIDEQDIVGDPLREDYDDLPSTSVPQFWYEEGHVFPNYTKDFTDERYGTSLAPIIDLEYIHYVDTVMLFYGDKTYDVIVRASKDAANFLTPEHWDFEVKIPASQIESFVFLPISIKKEVRYVQVEFVDGQSPNEVIVYGYALGESPDMEIKETSSHKRPTIGEMMGQCGFVAGGGGNCSFEQLACSYVVREYHNVGWSYSNGSFPGKAANFVNTVVGNFDQAYKDYSEAGFLVIPCLQWNEGSSPARVYDDLEGKLSGTIATWEEKYLPSTYAAYADLIYQYAARYGSSKMGYLVENMIAHSDAGIGAEPGRGYIEWIELGNEPNGEDAAGATPYQLAALQSAAYDGHQRTLLANVYNPNSFSYPFGGKNADPDIKLAIAGLAGVQDRYIMSMAYWMRANRTDNCIAMDAFNVHTYFGKYFTMNGQQIIVGVSPEEFGLVQSLTALVQYRDKYYPNVEVWLTEFGWDTNQSYETMTSAHAYNTKDANGDGIISDYEKVLRAREIQGMWLVRAYILLSSCGVDKATMYMCEDVGSNEATAIGKYGTCGIWYAPYTEDNWPIYKATMHGEDGKSTDEVFWVYKVTTGEGADEVVKYYKVDDNTEVKKQNTSDPDKDYSGITTETEYLPKDGYFYMYTLSETIGHMTFVKEIDSGNPDVWVYEFADGKGQVGYAVWCPTSDGTVVENFQLRVNGKTATHTTAHNNDIDGVTKNLQINDGFVTITVTENPSYVVVK